MAAFVDPQEHSFISQFMHALYDQASGASRDAFLRFLCCRSLCELGFAPRLHQNVHTLLVITTLYGDKTCLEALCSTVGNYFYEASLERRKPMRRSYDMYDNEELTGELQKVAVPARLFVDALGGMTAERTVSLISNMKSLLLCKDAASKIQKLYPCIGKVMEGYLESGLDVSAGGYVESLLVRAFLQHETFTAFDVATDAIDTLHMLQRVFLSPWMQLYETHVSSMPAKFAVLVEYHLLQLRRGAGSAPMHVIANTLKAFANPQHYSPGMILEDDMPSPSVGEMSPSPTSLEAAAQRLVLDARAEAADLILNLWFKTGDALLSQERRGGSRTICPTRHAPLATWQPQDSARGAGLGGLHVDTVAPEALPGFAKLAGYQAGREDAIADTAVALLAMPYLYYRHTYPSSLYGAELVLGTNINMDFILRHRLSSKNRQCLQAIISDVRNYYRLVPIAGMDSGMDFTMPTLAAMALGQLQLACDLVMQCKSISGVAEAASKSFQQTLHFISLHQDASSTSFGKLTASGVWTAGSSASDSFTSSAAPLSTSSRATRSFCTGIADDDTVDTPELSVADVCDSPCNTHALPVFVSDIDMRPDLSAPYINDPASSRNILEDILLACDAFGRNLIHYLPSIMELPVYAGSPFQPVLDGMDGSPVGAAEHAVVPLLQLTRTIPAMSWQPDNLGISPIAILVSSHSPHASKLLEFFLASVPAVPLHATGTRSLISMALENGTSENICALLTYLSKTHAMHKLLNTPDAVTQKLPLQELFEYRIQRLRSTHPIIHGRLTVTNRLSGVHLEGRPLTVILSLMCVLGANVRCTWKYNCEYEANPVDICVHLAQQHGDHVRVAMMEVMEILGRFGGDFHPKLPGMDPPLTITCKTLDAKLAGQIMKYGNVHELLTSDATGRRPLDHCLALMTVPDKPADLPRRIDAFARACMKGVVDGRWQRRKDAIKLWSVARKKSRF